eukprot:scaffold219397_cov35-Tisochrysis_lutea.AAC.1
MANGLVRASPWLLLGLCAGPARAVGDVGGSLVQRAPLVRAPHAAMAERSMYPFNLEEDRLLWRRHCAKQDDADFEETAALMGRGTQGLKGRLERLRDPTTQGHRRLFGELEDGDSTEPKRRLRTALDCIQRVLWDPLLDPADFTIHYRDRFDKRPLSFPMNAPNDSIRGPERLRALALPQHRILYIKYRKRLVWHRELRLDRVFGSGCTQAAMNDKYAEADVHISEDGVTFDRRHDDGEDGASRDDYVVDGERIQDVVCTYEDWLSADAAARSRAKMRAREALHSSSGRMHTTLEQRMRAVGELLSSMRDGEMSAEEGAATLLSEDLFGPLGGDLVASECPPQEDGEASLAACANSLSDVGLFAVGACDAQVAVGLADSFRYLTPVQELVSAVVPEEHSVMKSALLAALGRKL